MIELILLLSVILLGLLIGNKRVDKWLFLRHYFCFCYAKCEHLNFGSYVFIINNGRCKT